MPRRTSIGLSGDAQTQSILAQKPFIEPPPSGPPPDTTQWIIHGYISGWNGTVPQGPPGDQARISLCADDAGGSLPGTVIESKDFTVEVMDPTIVDCEFDLATDLSLDTYYWVTYERTGAWPANTDPSYIAYRLITTGAHPASVALYYDGDAWWDISGSTSYFALGGTDLPAGANSWTGVGGSRGGEVFGSGQVVKIATKFYTSSTPPPPPTRDTDNSSTGSYNDDNRGVEPIGSGSGNIVGNGIFYKWVAPADGTVIVRTDGQGLDQDITDTVLYILPNNTTLTPQTDAIAWNDDDGSSYYSETTFTAVQGTTYYFLVKAWGTDAKGTFKVSWRY